jgi:tRNA threonylcarbamoyladenosine biosynthesis protein TsaE
VIGLSGPLGAGKTTFARAFIREIARLSGETVDEVPSPTFTLVQIYAFARATVWHFDLYRIGAPDEAWELGLEDALAEGISLIEWPERLGPLLPARRTDVALAHGATADARIAEISRHG